MKNRKLWISIVAGLLVFFMLFSLIMSVIPARAHAASSAEIQEAIDALKEDQEALQQQMEELREKQEQNRNETASVVEQKAAIDEQIGLLYREIANINEQISVYSQLIADKQMELDAAQANLRELSEKNKERIRAMEEEGNLSYWSVLFKANSFSDLLDRLNMIEEIAAADQRRIEEMNEAALEVAAAQEALNVEKAALEQTKLSLDASQAELEQKRAESDELLTELIAMGEELEVMHEEYESKEDELIDELGRLEQEYNEAKQAEWEAAHPPQTSTGGSSDEDSGGSTGGYIASESDWIVPCSYVYISGTYGWRDAPTEGASTFHTGIDLAGPEGTPIYASRSGEVTRGGYNEYNGYYVGINHGDGFSSVYLHMTTYVVSIGDYVSQGQLIGYMGETGIATGPHLHLTIYYNGSTVNPADYIF